MVEDFEFVVTSQVTILPSLLLSGSKEIIKGIFSCKNITAKNSG
jgi:hypothetical protein